MADEVKPASIDFGALIAFVAPGFLAFWALSYVSEQAGSWMTSASKENQNVGVFLFVALTSLSLGLVVSGIRALCTRKWLFDEPVIDWSKVTSEKRLLVHDVRNGLYRHFQFYANMAVALLALSLVRFITRMADRMAQPPPTAVRQNVGDTVILILMLGGVCVLLLSARDSVARFRNALKTQ